MKKLVFAGAALAALVAVPVLAQPGPGSRGANAQPLTRSAVEAQVQARFARLDADRDGFVTQAEAKAGAEARRGDRQAKRAERQAQRGERRADLFARLDTDRNGSISRQEFDTRPKLSREDRAERRAERGGRRGGRMAHRGPRRGGGMMAAGFGARAFTALDARRDGFEVSVVEDACRAIDLNGSLARAWGQMAAKGVARVRSADIG